MIVAVIAVLVVQATVDEVIDMVSVWHGRVAAIRSMNMSNLMPFVAVLGRAAIGIGRIYLNNVLVGVVAVRMVQVAIVKIVDMVTVLNRGVAASRAVNVRMLGRREVFVFGHGTTLFKAASGIRYMWFLEATLSTSSTGCIAQRE